MNSDINGTVDSIESIIDEARNGRMFILVDDEDRENEGDLIIPAQMATPSAINFMALHGRGLICLALTRQRVEELGLPMMSRGEGDAHGTAFTISIEAKEGVTTGISAADRARTILTAVDASKGADALVSPGHIFPLAARDGGVLERAGHTEAAVDISRLAGLNPAGVICEIMNADGTMARLRDLFPFAREHGLKIGTIRDLIAYRRRNDRLIERVSDQPFVSHFGGEWRLLTYRNKIDSALNYALVKGQPDPAMPILTRVHRSSLAIDLLGQVDPSHRSLHSAMLYIAEAGQGVIVLLVPSQAQQYELTRSSGEAEHGISLRHYGIGAEILADLGVHEIVLLSRVPDGPIVGLEAYGLQIVDHQSLDSLQAI